MFEIFKAFEYNADVSMIFPQTLWKNFVEAVKKSSFDNVVNNLRPFKIQDAIATNECDRKKINTIIEKHLGCRMEVEEICGELGLDVFCNSKKAVFDSGSRADGRASYVYNSAEGTVDGEKLRWDHIERKVFSIDNGEVMYDLDEGLEKMNDMVNSMVAQFFRTVKRFMVRRTTGTGGDDSNLSITTDLVFVMRNAIGAKSTSPKNAALRLDSISSLPPRKQVMKKSNVRQVMSELF